MRAELWGRQLREAFPSILCSLPPVCGKGLVLFAEAAWVSGVKWGTAWFTSRMS